jgi:Ser/Thr protein kinase RdoA (MazF antagonist)
MITLPVSYSVTCANTLLRDIIPQFQIEEALQCEFWCQGLNDSYKVKTKNNTFLLRIYRHRWRDFEAINFEVEVLLHLQKNGANVAYPIATKQGDYIVKIKAPEGVRYIILTRYADGHELNFSDHYSATLYGQHMAQTHLLTEQFRTSHCRFKLDVKHLVTEPIERIRPFLDHRQDDWHYIKNSAKTLVIQLQKLLDESKDIGFCHGDMHGGNAHYDGTQLISFDFDCCGLGLRVYDLAIFKWSLAVNKADDSTWQRFLTSYQQHRPLLEQDLQQIDFLVSIRHIWLIGLHIDVTVAKGWLNDAYFDQKLAFLKSYHSQCNKQHNK